MVRAWRVPSVSFAPVYPAKEFGALAYQGYGELRGAQNCVKIVFLSYNQIEIVPLYILKYVDVVYLRIHYVWI
jgi:hypothetical protein